MLPPFVPPSVRVASENLPLITEFVIDRVERSFESSFSLSGESGVGGVATLPSIDEFVRDEAEVLDEAPVGYDEFVQRTSRSPWGTYEAEHEVKGNAEAPSPSSSHAALEPDLLLGGHRSSLPPGSHDAIVNEVAEPADAWTASAPATRTDAGSGRSGSEQSSTAAPEVWVAEERDAFDWHAAANLATPPADAQRAADEWSSTEWERSSGSVQDHIAALLAQVSRRVRSGELEVQGSKQMGSEAALVATLAALLAESARK